MDIKTFIKEKILVPRLQKKQVLVVYDPDFRYRDLCMELSGDRSIVVDASESSILSRAEAIESLIALGRNEIDQLLIYIPKEKPIEDEDKQKDPFSFYVTCGAVFPDGDGDTYLSICLEAKSDHQTQVRSVFRENSNPSFSVIDAIGGGLNWPNLRALLKVDSARGILFALLVPNESQKDALKSKEGWVSEVKDLLNESIGLILRTKRKTWESLSDELWRYLLFSEFVFDLPGGLPSSLIDVPHANDSAKPLIEDLCENLRSDSRTRNIYIQKAEEVEQLLNLVENCRGIENLGVRVTFPFEERTFIRQTAESLVSENVDIAREMLLRHSKSVWIGKGESQIQWDFLRSSLNLIEKCHDSEEDLGTNTRSMEDLVDYYVRQLRKVDHSHREFEQAAADVIWQDNQDLMDPVLKHVRKLYGKLVEKVQFEFTKHLQKSGWPLIGRLSNSDVFDKIISPKLEISGNKIAYIMVDALRYELGVELYKQLSEDAQVEISCAMVQLPSITSVGMASLLPGASNGLRLIKKESGCVPFIHDNNVENVPQRMEHIRKKYGNRFQEGRLDRFLKKEFKILPDTDLLVLRSVEIDNSFESNPDTAPNELVNSLKKIRSAVHSLSKIGFKEVIIATDHGFFMNTHAGPGDTCSKLSGDWINIHERSLLGNGASDDKHYRLETDKVGIKGDFKYFAGPLSLASYKSGMLYYHGGCSLQECIVPVIQLSYKKQLEHESDDVSIELNYKNGIKHITTRVPVIEVSASSQSLFSVDKNYEVLLEAHNKKGEIVGEAKRGGVVDASTGTLSLLAGERVQVTLKMDMNFEGEFIVKAFNPTTMAVYSQLKLDTNYTV